MARLKEAFINENGVRISTITGKPVRVYNKTHKVWQTKRDFSDTPKEVKPKRVTKAEMAEQAQAELLSSLASVYTNEEISLMISKRTDAAPVELIDIPVHTSSGKETNVGFLIASDWHADETVKASTVLGKNEFNEDIARQRITNYFSNAAKMCKKQNLDELVFASIGDMIGGWIHDELAQTNSMSPMSGIQMVKQLMISGLKHLSDELTTVKKITFVGICGNHTRTSKKMQFSNGFELSHEFYMYKDIQAMCELMGMDKIEFIIPESEFAYLNIYGENILFCHGHQFRSAGGVGGIYPSMFKWFGKMNQTIQIDKAFIGHYHTSIWTKEVCVNGSIKGYDAFAMGHGLGFEEPRQTFCVLNAERGFTYYAPVFVD